MNAEESKYKAVVEALTAQTIELRRIAEVGEQILRKLLEADAKPVGSTQAHHDGEVIAILKG